MSVLSAGPLASSLAAPHTMLPVLLVITSVLYVLTLNLVLGGMVMVAVSSVRGRSDPQHRQFAGLLAGRLLPATTILTIALGLVPHLLHLSYGEHYLRSMTSSGWAGFLHFFIGALGVAGLGGTWLARSRRASAPEFAAWAERYSRLWFHAAIGCELLIGCWYLFSLPRDVRGLFLGGSRLATVLIITASLLAIMGIIAVRRSLVLATIAIVISLTMMVIMRQMMGLYYPGNIGKMRMERDFCTRPHVGVEVLCQEVSCVDSCFLWWRRSAFAAR